MEYAVLLALCGSSLGVNLIIIFAIFDNQSLIIIFVLVFHTNNSMYDIHFVVIILLILL